MCRKCQLKVTTVKEIQNLKLLDISTLFEKPFECERGLKRLEASETNVNNKEKVKEE